MQSVAASISERGPAAWPEYFDKTPAFFLAVDGQVQFSDGPAAQAGIPRLARMIKKIELRWGDALRVDPLSDDLAMVGAPWHENVTLADGHLLDTSGYFTAVAERVQGRWQFRNAHWSSFQPNNFVK